MYPTKVNNPISRAITNQDQILQNEFLAFWIEIMDSNPQHDPKRECLII